MPCAVSVRSPLAYISCRGLVHHIDDGVHGIFVFNVTITSPVITLRTNITAMNVHILSSKNAENLRISFWAISR